MKESLWYQYRPRLGIYVDGVWLNGVGWPGSGPPPARTDLEVLRADPEIRRDLAAAVGGSQVVLRQVEAVQERNRALLTSVRAAMGRG